MEFWGSPVRSALRRWESKGFLERNQVAALRAEADRSETASRRRFAQFAVGATAGAVVLLGVAIFLAIPFLFVTFDVALDAPHWLTAVGVVGMGASALSYGLQRGFREVVLVSFLALVAAAWFLGVETGRALAAALALSFTGILLFWVSAVMGRGGGDAAPEESGG